MKLFLMRHGDAENSAIDSQRKLSTLGIREVTQVAELLNQASYSFEHIFHSGKKRAQETAEIVAAKTKSTTQLAVLPFLEPTDEVDELFHCAQTWTEDTLIVGHQPFMGIATAKFLTQAPASSTFSFGTASIAGLERIGSSDWTLSFLLNSRFGRKA